ncbi:MAG: branched-chain amino acid ABC transporter permease [Deltaproteobacteria bacterium]|nr:branched-chain amino acid ABC transporter permease [Deltaproteobacteria bacterium]MBW2179736.1 branched-chain amino acid ABC transporter permease [Deltaproteobacteria bacterium]
MIKQNYIKKIEVYFIIIFLLLPLLFDDIVYNHIMVIAGIYAIAALGLSLFLGYAGQISIGHAAFFGIGGYSMAILSTRFGLPSALSLLAAGLISGLLAFIVGKPILKLREYFLALATIGLVQIFQVFATELTDLTGGVSGIYGIPWFSIFGFEFDTSLKQFYLVWFILYILFVYSRHLIHSKYGKASLAVAFNEDTSKTIGIDPSQVKLNFFVLSAVYAGIGGGLFVSVLTSVSPESFGLNMSVIFVMMVIIGGMGSLFGTITGAVLLTWIINWLGEYQAYSLPFFGIILILFLVFLPEGIFRGIGLRWFDFVRTYADENWRKEIDK